MNLKNLDFDELLSALPNASRSEVLKIFASVFAHGAQDLGDVAKTKQVTALTRDFVAASATLPITGASARTALGGNRWRPSSARRDHRRLSRRIW